MCGIVGAFKPFGSEVCSQERVATMRDRMAHRSPDGAGLLRSADGRCALGHRRLAIIDLSEAALQAMSNASEFPFFILSDKAKDPPLSIESHKFM